MELPKSLTTVTPLSKILALFLFTILPILAFVFGMNYQKIVDNKNVLIYPTPTPQEVSCTLETRICPDGSSVGRAPPNCEFSPCPKTDGGINPIYNTNDGKNDLNSNYQCPNTEYIDCEPGVGVVKSQCSQEYLQWAGINCPGFKGAAF